MFGTQDKRFDRLMNAILQADFSKEHEVYVQTGYTKGVFTGIHSQEYYTEEEMLEEIAKADLIITHAGVGSIVAALKLHKKVLVVPRLGKYKEQNNDHQKEIMYKFAKDNYILPVEDETKLDAAIEQSKDWEPAQYTSNKEGILETLQEFIRNI